MYAGDIPSQLIGKRALKGILVGTVGPRRRLSSLPLHGATNSRQTRRRLRGLRAPCRSWGRSRGSVSHVAVASPSTRQALVPACKGCWGCPRLSVRQSCVGRLLVRHSCVGRLPVRQACVGRLPVRQTVLCGSSPPTVFSAEGPASRKCLRWSEALERSMCACNPVGN